jgi:DNA-binding transcriptional regulator GbsR (MarR family)
LNDKIKEKLSVSQVNISSERRSFGKPQRIAKAKGSRKSVFASKKKFVNFRN